MKNVKVYIATHKKANLPELKEYVPIQVGAEGKEKLGYITDNTGENISNKNPNFCELTATYWIMKNDNSDIVVLTHYRRYFFNNIFSNSFKNIIHKEKIIKILNNYDIIVPKKYKLGVTVEKQYSQIHNIEDLMKCGEIIKNKNPEYSEAFDKVLKKRKIYTYNMFISRKKVFDDYYKWLFDILFEAEKIIDISNYDNYNKRVYGFLSERLFNVWIEKNKDNLKIKEMPVYNSEEKIIKQLSL